MRPLIFLFPDHSMTAGGNSAQARFARACSRFAPTSLAYYGERAAGQLHLSDVLERGAETVSPADSPIFVIHWGPDVAMLLQALNGRDVVYFAHSTGWKITLPPEVPILCVSRHTLGFWGRHAPNSYIAYTPNIVETAPAEQPQRRDVDVLVQRRKSSGYLLDELVPALEQRCRVTVLDGWVDDLSLWFRRAKVYLYDSIEHWIDVGATEGFGLPPLEALAHGCTVFSSVNDALADYLDPGFNCRKIRVHSREWDVEAVLRAVAEGSPEAPQPEWFQRYSDDNVATRLESIFADLHQFFAETRGRASDIADLWLLRRPTPLQRAKRAIKVLAGP
ncbi:hypothetical protein [Novosphingobium soli]|uniref:Glycosyltransferase n=1 Tax=Novosphingobium soli TaxID=574956 RepID=A0ABV6CV43_9SPHN